MMQLFQSSTFIHALFVSLFVLLSPSGGSGQLNDVPPDCLSGLNNIQKCITLAVDASKATGCNWFRLIGPLSNCISEAVAGCDYDEQEVWYDYIKSFNKTMTDDDCYPSCTNQDTRSKQMFQCFTDADFEHLVNEIYSTQDVQSSDRICGVLDDMHRCLLIWTSGCPALTDVAHDRVHSNPNSAVAYSRCGIAQFQAATTNAPVALLDTNSVMPDPVPTTISSGSLSTSETLLVTFGSILIVTTLIVVFIVIALTIRRRQGGYRRSMLEGWRPNGQKVYLDEPAPLPAHSNSLYRPVTISHNSGFLD